MARSSLDIYSVGRILGCGLYSRASINGKGGNEVQRSSLPVYTCGNSHFISYIQSKLNRGYCKYHNTYFHPRHALDAYRINTLHHNYPDDDN